MKTFLKVALIVVLTLLAVKLVPVTLAIGCILAAAIAAALALGVSAALVVVAIALAIVAALSPIWIPVLAVIGVIALIRRSSRSAVKST